MQASGNDSTMDDTIRRLYIEPSSRCNLTCAMCFRHAWQDEQFADMDYAVFEAVMRHLPDSVESIFLGGMGEPLVHPRIVDMVAQAAATGRRVEMITNATLLTPERSRQLVEAGLGWLWVSIDSFEAEAFGHIRQDKDYARLLAHLEAFNQARNVRWHLGGVVRLGVNFVVSKSNVGQLGKIPSFAFKYTVDKVNISNFIPPNREAEKQVLCDRVIEWDMGLPREHQCSIDLPMLNWRDAGAMEGLRDLLSSTHCQLSLSGQTITRKNRYCRFVEEGQCFVRHDGLVAPCMELLHTSSTSWHGYERLVRRHTFGHVAETPIGDIWNSREYTDFRDRVRRFDFSPCLHCSGCQLSEDNNEDCYGNEKPTCGACLWAEGLVSCP